MRVLVIGATGGTGQLAVDRLLAGGHQVAAFARDPRRVRARPNLSVLQGEARDRASILRAVVGQEAVLSAFGPRSLKADDLQTVLTQHLLEAMQAAGTKRLINLSAWGAGDSRNQSNLSFRFMRATLLRAVYRDKDRADALLLASDRDFVNVRPGRLVDGPARGGVKASLQGKGLRPEMTRADLAAFMVEQLSQDTWLRQSPLIGY